MRLNKLTRIAVAMVFAALPGSSTEGRSGSITNVTTVVHDLDITDALLLMRSDDNNGSGQATYISGGSGGTSISSTITTIGEWDLNLSNQWVRTLWVTPNDDVGAQPAGLPAGYYAQNVVSSSRCFDQNGNVVPLQNILTSSGNCKLGVNFKVNGTLYKLLMSPFPFSGPNDGTPICPSTGCPTTGVVSVTCNSVSNGQCVSWTIVPNSSTANANVANLYWQHCKGASCSWVYIGQYYNTFRIDLANP